MIILSVDLGKVRTGLAVCDKDEILAVPLCTINETSTETLANVIIEKAKEKKAELIVVGLPKNMDSTEGESAKNARSFAGLLERLSDIKVELFDERCTTMAAQQYLNNTNTRGRARKKVIDTVSAVIILQDYLQKRKNDREIF